MCSCEEEHCGTPCWLSWIILSILAALAILSSLTITPLFSCGEKENEINYYVLVAVNSSANGNNTQHNVALWTVALCVLSCAIAAAFYFISVLMIAAILISENNRSCRCCSSLRELTVLIFVVIAMFANAAGIALAFVGFEQTSCDGKSMKAGLILLPCSLVIVVFVDLLATVLRRECCSWCDRDGKNSRSDGLYSSVDNNGDEAADQNNDIVTTNNNNVLYGSITPPTLITPRNDNDSSNTNNNINIGAGGSIKTESLPLIPPANTPSNSSLVPTQTSSASSPTKVSVVAATMFDPWKQRRNSYDFEDGENNLHGDGNNNNLSSSVGYQHEEIEEFKI